MNAIQQLDINSLLLYCGFDRAEHACCYLYTHKYWNMPILCFQDVDSRLFSYIDIHSLKPCQTTAILSFFMGSQTQATLEERIPEILGQEPPPPLQSVTFHKALARYFELKRDTQEEISVPKLYFSDRLNEYLIPLYDLNGAICNFIRCYPNLMYHTYYNANPAILNIPSEGPVNLCTSPFEYNFNANTIMISSWDQNIGTRVLNTNSHFGINPYASPYTLSVYFNLLFHALNADYHLHSFPLDHQIFRIGLSSNDLPALLDFVDRLAGQMKKSFKYENPNHDPYISEVFRQHFSISHERIGSMVLIQVPLTLGNLYRLQDALISTFPVNIRIT